MAEIISDEINDYLLAHTTPQDDVLRDLAAETRALFPDAAGMQITHDEGELLTMLVRLTGARYAVEVGVFTGYSGLCIARGLPKDGRLVCCDVSEEYTAVARRFWARAAVDELIELRLGPAIGTLQQLEAGIDFAFVDADKTGYPDYYDALVPKLRPGGLMVLDNTLRDGRVLQPSHESDVVVSRLNDRIVTDERVESVLLPVRDGVTLVRKR
ncbi:class I SAM-dependent methyltransferase [Actinoplanes sp. NPDC049596]|uniref:O-methyltransferase n=1 Tax=unclassified Actinoplanes TaxID=2626549 RepID=UPI003442F6F6